MHIGRRRPSKRNYTNSSITPDTDAMIRCLHKRYAMCLAMGLTVISLLTHLLLSAPIYVLVIISYIYST